MVPRPPTPLARAPGRRLQLANFLVFEAAWFAAVLGAAHGEPLLGTCCVLAAIGWHLSVSARPSVEARLVLALAAIGFIYESVVVLLGQVAYPSGQPVAWLAPYWMVALWGELAIALNVTLRWLKGRPWLAAALGAIGGPASFAGGVRLGGAHWIVPTAAVAFGAVAWALLLPSVMRLSMRWDGVAEALHA